MTLKRFRTVIIIMIIYHMGGVKSLKMKENEKDNGDVGIKFIGLRPGEKLHEELVFDNSYVKSSHPMIYYCEEKILPYLELKEIISELSQAIKENSSEKILLLLSKYVEGFRYNS